MDQGMDTGEKAPHPKKSLDEIVERIKRYSNGDNEEGVNLFPNPHSGNSEEEARKEDAANIIYDGLLLTLGNIGEYAVAKAKRGTSNSKEYEHVARAVEPLAQVVRGLVDDKVPLVKNRARERLAALDQDTIYVYDAHDFILDDTPFKTARVFIRPHLYRQPLEVRTRQQRPTPNVSEIALPKMLLAMTPLNTDEGEVVIRVDREDARRNYEITYDVIINSRGHGDVLQDLSFRAALPGTPQPDQREGHHFSSNWTAEDLGVTFSEILETYNRRFERVATSTS